MDVPFPSFEEIAQSIRDDTPGRDPLARLEHAVAAGRRLVELNDAVLDHFVQAARAEGHTWAEIGAILGVTKQAAQQRYVSGRPTSLGDVTANVLEKLSGFEASSLVAFPQVTGSVRGMERFTDEARTAVMAAAEEARVLGHAVLGTEHLLLGLVSDASWGSALCLRDLGVAKGVRRMVVRRVSSGRGPIPVATPLAFSGHARTALSLSMRAALRAGTNEIETEHLLLAVLEEGEGVGAAVLNDLGIEIDDVRGWIDGRGDGDAPDDEGDTGSQPR